MTSYIIAGTNLTEIEKKTEAILSPFHIDHFDKTHIKREVDEKTDKIKQSLGIADIKRMQQKVFLKPLKSENKALILEEAELLTTEAQNALLKMLEEPPLHTIIVLQTHNLEALLPTIRSRCSIIMLEEQTIGISDEERTSLLATIQTMNTWGIGEALNQAETLGKNKQDAIVWLEKSILVAREKMLKELDNQHYPKLIRRLQESLTILSKTNANPRLQLEGLFFSLR